MLQSATAADAEIIMRLYDLRREEKLRRARNWFFAEFKGIKSMDEFLKRCPVGSEENAYYRMVVTYWDMAAGFANSGVVNKDLFFRSSNELLFVWIRACDLISDHRRVRQNPLLMGDLEEAADSMKQWLDGRAPGAYQSFRKMVLG